MSGKKVVFSHQFLHDFYLTTISKCVFPSSFFPCRTCLGLIRQLAEEKAEDEKEEDGKNGDNGGSKDREKGMDEDERERNIKRKRAEAEEESLETPKSSGAACSPPRKRLPTTAAADDTAKEPVKGVLRMPGPRQKEGEKRKDCGM